MNKVKGVNTCARQGNSSRSVALIRLHISASRSMTSSRRSSGTTDAPWPVIGQTQKAKTFLKWPHLIGPAPPPPPPPPTHTHTHPHTHGCSYRGNKTSSKALRDQNSEGDVENPTDESNTSAGASVHSSS